MWRYLYLIPFYLLSTSLPLALKAGANLEYEYALLCSYLAFLLIPLAAFVLPRRYLPVKNGVFTLPLAVESIWTLLLSPVLGLLSGLYIFAAKLCSCSPSGFGFWMAVLWYPAWILAHVAFYAVLRARIATHSRLRAAFALSLVYIGAIALAATDLWIHPQKRLVHLFAGFLHGPIYDEWISIDHGILLARLSHLLLALALLTFAWLRAQKVLAGICLTLMVSYGLTGYFAQTYPSVRNGKKYLDKLMPARIEGDGFTLHYLPPPKPAPESEPAALEGEALLHPAKTKTADRHAPQKIQRLFRDASFHVTELTALLQEPVLPHVHIYVYPSTEQKKLWFGGGATDVADVKTPSIHITADSWPHGTLRHELVHALTSGFAFHGLGFHPNMAFTEGLAVALAPQESGISLHEGAAALISSKKLPPIENLFSPFFWREAGNRAYTVAGSLLQYLIEAQGIDGVKALYAGKTWEEAFGQSQITMLSAWHEYVLTQSHQEQNQLYAEALYRYPGVLAELCPHSKADLRRPRDEGLYTRLRQPVGWDPEAEYLPWLQKMSPSDASIRLRIWRREINALATERIPSAESLAKWQKTLLENRVWPPAGLEDVEQGIIESDLARISGNYDRSLEILSELMRLAKSKRLGGGLEREIEARLMIEHLVDGEQALDWRRFLAGWRKQMPVITSEAPWLLKYLKLRNTPARALPREKIEAWLTAEPDSLLSKNFHLEWYKVIGLKLMSLNSFDAASTAYKKAADVAPDSQKAVLLEHARRATYYAKQGPLAYQAAEVSSH